MTGVLETEAARFTLSLSSRGAHLSCHPEERSDEGSLSAPGRRRGLRGIPRFARDDRGSGDGGGGLRSFAVIPRRASVLSSRGAQRRGIPLGSGTPTRAERDPSLRSG